MNGSPSSDAGNAAVRSPRTAAERRESADNAFDAVLAALMECQFQATVGIAKLTKLMVEYRMAVTDDTPPDPDDP